MGYCQGLCFVTGVLLLHLEEEDAFNMLTFLMFDLGLRQQYKPSMTAVQVTWTHMYAQTEGWDCNWVYILKYKTHFQ